MASAASSSAPVIAKGAVHGVAPLRAGQGTRFCCAGCIPLGIVPVGAFLFEHILISNSTAITGPDAYARQVSFLANLPLVFFLELFGIWLPIAFHALYGFYIWYRGDGNTIAYPWTGNWMYTCSAGPAESRSSTSFGTRARCDSQASTCTITPWLRLGRFRWRFMNPPTSCFMWSGWSRRPGIFATASGCSRRSGESLPARRRRKAFWRFVSRSLLFMTRAGWPVSLRSGTLPAATAEPGTSVMQSSPATSQ